MFKDAQIEMLDIFFIMMLMLLEGSFLALECVK